MNTEMIHSSGEGYTAQDAAQDIQTICNEFREYNTIDTDLYNIYPVARGLRNADGTGVVAGLTQICNVHGYVMDE